MDGDIEADQITGEGGTREVGSLTDIGEKAGADIGIGDIKTPITLVIATHGGLGSDRGMRFS